MKDFSYLKPGDKVTRMLAGTVPMMVVVGLIEDGLIYCGSNDGYVKPDKVEGWSFRIENGAEVDTDLGWDGIKTTGSFLKHSEEQQENN